MNQSNDTLTPTLPTLEKRLFFGQCPHCVRPAIVWDRALDSLQCEGCGAVWERREALSQALADMTAQRDAWACECGTDNDWCDKVCVACGSDRPNAEHDPRAEASRAPCSCSASLLEAK
jgi:hypothetical protein